MKWTMSRYVNGRYVTEDLTMNQVIGLIGKAMTIRMVKGATKYWMNNISQYGMRKLFTYCGDDAEIILERT